MNTSMVSNRAPSQITPQRPAARTEPMEKGPEMDRDSDDAAGAAQATKPGVNLNGQALGQIINLAA